MDNMLVSEAIGKFRSRKASASTKTRKALQVLQVSTTDGDLVASPGMMQQRERNTLKPSEVSIKDTRGDENGSKEHLLRRSKRKNLPQQNEGKEVQKESKPAKNLKKVPKASKAKAAKSKCVPVNSNQSNLDSFVSVTSKSADVCIPIKKEEVSEHSIFQDNTIDDTLLANEYSMRVVRSTSDETNMLTSDEPGTVYWKMLAEQRRSALEIALYENEQLKNELEVLEVENGQLKNILQELESVVEVINASLM